MDTEEDTHYSPPLEGIRKTSEKSYQKQSSAPHVHFEVTSSQTPSSQYSPALSTASNSSSGSSPNSLSKKIGITIKKSPNSDRTFETSLLGLSIDKEEKRTDETDDSDEDSNDGMNTIGGNMDSDSSSSSSSSSSSNIESSSDSEVRFKSSAIIAE